MPVTTTKTENTPSEALYSCDYTNDAGTNGFDLSIIGPPLQRTNSWKH